MNLPKHETETDKLRQDILDAAQNRFLTYGVGKTTMAEIASDASMSAANLYRYFQNKQDIAIACAGICMCTRNDRIREAIHQSHLSAAQRLYTFAIEAYSHNFNLMKDMPKALELVQAVCDNNPDLIKQDINKQVALIAEILSYGNETGEFEIKDVINQADTIYSSFLLFDVPIFIPLYTKQEFEDKAQRMVNLIVEGIRKR